MFFRRVPLRLPGVLPINHFNNKNSCGHTPGVIKRYVPYKQGASMELYPYRYFHVINRKLLRSYDHYKPFGVTNRMLLRSMIAVFVLGAIQCFITHSSKTPSRRKHRHIFLISICRRNRRSIYFFRHTQLPQHPRNIITATYDHMYHFAFHLQFPFYH